MGDEELEILEYFNYSHLPGYLQDVSMPFFDLAWSMTTRFRPTDEVKAGYRKLLEAKDCFVRAALTKKKLSEGLD